ncbi:hypothetical protein LRS13_01555 [Svornostia abyssi]|uniref:Uncharacterized protein n=1 Tax=Svornostia abyssi TaxID=2898438 RepID=A0ABY5PHT5_9ACTN|nr:hypothetical protein LRS13_01555 [Parviterribacteraceae bacterium J379]
MAVLRDHDGPVLVGFVHSGLATAFFSRIFRIAGRRGFLPNWRTGHAKPWPTDGRPLTAHMVRRYWTQTSGGLWVGPQRRYDVYGRLLAEGEMVVAPIDAAGTGASSFLGARVRTTTAPARLSLAHGAPLIVGTCVRGDHGVVIRLSAPIGAGSVAERQRAALACAERDIGGDPAQLLLRELPLADVLEWQARRDQAAAAVEAAQEYVGSARAALAEAREAGRAEAAVRVAGAKLEVSQARTAYRDACTARDAIVRPEPPARLSQV